METVYLALGSNMGDSRHFFEKAVELLGQSVRDIDMAPLYRSKPVGYTNQPDFLNTVVRGRTQLTPQQLLEFIKTVEQKTGRVKRFRWGPREIDIDIILYGDHIVERKDLTIPHARFREREFVLRPLCDLNPEIKDPLTKQTAQQLLDAMTQPSIMHHV